MPTIPGEIAERSYRLAMLPVAGELLVTRAFQKYLGELAMGRYIYHVGRTRTDLPTLNQIWDSMLRAFTWWVGVAPVITTLGDYIQRQTALWEWYRSFPVVERLLAFRHMGLEKMTEKEREALFYSLVEGMIGTTLTEHQRREAKIIADYTPKFVFEAGERMARQYNWSREAKRRWVVRTWNEIQALRYYIFSVRRLKKRHGPFFWFETAVLFSYIHLKYIYDQIAQELESRKIIPAWIVGQPAIVRIGRKEVAKAYPAAQGIYQWWIPPEALPRPKGGTKIKEGGT